MASTSTGGRGTAVTVVTLAVALLAVFGALNSYQVSARFAEQYPDAYGAGRAQVRFAPVLEHVPVEARLAYLTDLDPASDAYSAAFLAAQYALAPRQLVIPGKAQPAEWAVGNFSRPLDYAAVGAGAGYEVVADLGNGVVLYRRKA